MSRLAALAVPPAVRKPATPEPPAPPSTEEVPTAKTTFRPAPPKTLAEAGVS
ncbi:MAG: hypothetical protein HRF43_11320, partial [Phycisphaerae bacterium]